MVPIKNEHLIKTPSTGGSRAEARLDNDTGSPGMDNKDGVQGEGNYEASRRFNEAERKFVASGKVAAAVRAAAPKSEAECQEMIAAEKEGKRRAKAEDPAPTRRAT